MLSSISSTDEYRAFLSSTPAAILFFTQSQCAICTVLLPKIRTMLEEFPHIKLEIIDVTQATEVSGQLSVFTIPTIITFFDGKETFRASRSFAIRQLRDAIQRPYHIFFPENKFPV